MPEPGGAVAAIDCGTNSTRLLVVDGTGRTLDRQMRITRLGAGVDATGLLDPGAVGRTVAVLEDFRRRMEQLGVVRARLVATSAARDAANGEQFLAAAAKATGVEAELLTGEEEGKLSFAGATRQLPAGVPRDEPLLVVDIGGGSTELVVGRADDPRTVRAVSVDVGCVRLSERCLRQDPPRGAELEEARSVAQAVITAAASSLPAPAPGTPAVGLAGTVSTVAALEQRLVTYNRGRLHHSVLTREVVERWAAVLAGERSSERLAHPGMMRGREDVIVGGVLVLAVVLAVFARDLCLVSEDDILDGLVVSLEAP